jgi:DNA repair ATPase RecN
MKKPILTLALAVLFIPGIIITGCKSPTKNAEDAKENVQDAQKNLKDAKQEANTAVVKAANEQEWKSFKIDAEAQIKQNELRIAELKIKLKKPGKGLDEADKQRIDALEKRNDGFKSRMKDYEKDQGDWESFKREYNRDMDELKNAFNNLDVDNNR